MIITKKIKLIVDGDKKEQARVYEYIRNGCYAQNTAYNYLQSVIFEAYRRGEDNEVRKELYKMGSRNKGSKVGPSLYDNLEQIEFPKGLATPAAVGYYAKKDMAAQIKAGLLKGRISLRNRKLDAPLWIASKKFLSFYSEYETEDEIWEAAYKKEFEVFLKFVNGITFKLFFGNPYKSRELRTTIARILTEEYTPCGSSIQIKDGKIFLNLSVDIGKSERKDLDEKVSVGCHIGFGVPILCVCNNDNFEEVIGSTEGFLAQRAYIQETRRRLQAGLRYTSGGHGRKKKLAALDRMKNRENNFVKTCNHQWSSAIIKYALSHNAKYINLEVIDSKELEQYVLRNWSYYMLQEYIKYKAEKNGITVRFVKLDEKDYQEGDATIAKKIATATNFVSERQLEKNNSAQYDIK